MIWFVVFLLILMLAAYFRWSLAIWSVLSGLVIASMYLCPDVSQQTITTLWIIYLVIVIPLNLRPLRKLLFSSFIFKAMRSVMPTISQTEQEALDAGDVWWEAELFSGKPDFSVIRNLEKHVLTQEEQDFIDGPVEQLCDMIDDWKVVNEDFDLSPEVWQFIKDNGFFAMIIPKKYGGLEFSARCHSEVLIKISSRSSTAAITVMVPNSLGPGKLLMTYGTKEQKDYYLPRLAKGIDVPCFALTGPTAGSDAGSMPDTGIVCYGSFEGKDNVLGVRLNWEKRYITLAPIASLLGIAFKLDDPDHILSDQVERGITLALVKRDTEGVAVGNRHYPSNQSFMNGPIRGKDVFIPMDWIIGGEEYIGKGWSMLMECLSDGRAISLPALGVSAGKMASRYTGAYSRIRKQFRTPIGYFEGVEEVLAEIGGQTYAMNASRTLVLTALDNGKVPSVISGIVKQQLMERMRTVVNFAMDIHGGHAICVGPRNFVARAYSLVPVGITVEGANILTRSMIIFGQGAMRSHPYILKEVTTFQNPDKKQALSDFDDAFFSHIGFIISNKVRSFILALTGARFVKAPGTKVTNYYYRQLIRMSASFAFLTDICLAILGGSLKRREKISGRLADVLSNLYVLTAVLKYFEDDGHIEDDIPLMEWACKDALYNTQEALKGVLLNLPVPVIGKLVNLIIFPLGKPYQKPDDKLGHKVARCLLRPSDIIDRLSHGIFISKDKNDATGRLEYALQCVFNTSQIERKLRGLFKNGTLSKYDAYEEAKDKNLISDEEFEQLKITQQAVANAIKVDEFSFSGWEVRTP